MRNDRALAPPRARRRQDPIEALVIVQMRDRVDLLLVERETDRNDGPRTRGPRAVSDRKNRRRIRASSPAGRTPAEARGRHPGPAGPCRPSARGYPISPRSWHRPATRRETAAAAPCPASPAERGDAHRAASRSMIGRVSSSSGIEEKADTTYRFARSRKPRPCAAAAAASRGPWADMRPALSSRMRARRVFFSILTSSAGCNDTSGGCRESRKCRAAMAVGAAIPLGPYNCRWAPCVRNHGSGQGQLPSEFL